jgi:hypothetical protein
MNCDCERKRNDDLKHCLVISIRLYFFYTLYCLLVPPLSLYAYTRVCVALYCSITVQIGFIPSRVEVPEVVLVVSTQ